MAKRRNEELEALRAEVKRRHKAATSKVSRLRSRGVELGGTGYDVRRDLSQVKRYNTTQLRGYLNRLDSFVDRSNAFVPGDSGIPLPAAKWREYKRAEKRYNSIGAREFEKVAETFLPTPGRRIRDRYEQLSQRALGASVNSPYQQINRRSRNIASIEALDRLTQQMESRTAKDYLPSQIKKSREELNTMLKEIGNSEYAEMADRLTDDQFDTLWNYTSFANEISSDYEIMKLKARGEAERHHEKISQDNANAIDELLQWAQFLPKKKGRR